MSGFFSTRQLLKARSATQNRLGAHKLYHLMISTRNICPLRILGHNGDMKHEDLLRQPPSARRVVANNDLPVYEWNFAAVPTVEKEACYLYEYAREFFKRSTQLQRFLKDWKNPRKKDSGNDYVAWLKALDLLQTNCENFPYIDFENFPAVAWQGLGAWPKQANKHVQINLRQTASQHVNEWSKRFRKSRFDRFNIATLRELEPPNNRTMEDFQFYHECSGHRKLDHTEYGFFAIDWSFRDSEIIRAFKQWLDGQRQERNKLGLSDAVPVRNRGGFGDRLNWLAALRLKNHYRKRDLVNHHDTYLKCSQWPYRHYSDLCEAANRAEKEIARLFPSQWSEAAWRRKQEKRANVPLPEIFQQKS